MTALIGAPAAVSVLLRLLTTTLGVLPGRPAPSVRPRTTPVLLRSSWVPQARFTTVEPQNNLVALSDDELCRGWRACCAALDLTGDHVVRGAQVSGILALRARYLEEMERRHPWGFAAWTDASVRGPSDPGRYLAHRIPRQRRGPEG